MTDHIAPSDPEALHALPAEHPLTIAQAAAYLNVSERYIRRLRAERRVAVVKYGRTYRFLRRDLDAFLSASRLPVPEAARQKARR